MILATNDLSIYLPFCAKKQKRLKTIPQLELKVSTLKKASHSSASPKKINKNINWSAPDFMLQKLSARTISKQCGLASAHGARGRKRAQRVNDSGFSEAPSASSSHTVCVEVQKTIPPSFLFSPLSFSLSLTCSPVASSLKLAHCCIDARSKTFTWRMRFTFLLKSLFSSSSHQLSTTKEFQRSWNWGERERRAEQAVTKQASLLPKTNL